MSPTSGIAISLKVKEHQQTSPQELPKQWSSQKTKHVIFKYSNNSLWTPRVIYHNIKKPKQTNWSSTIRPTWQHLGDVDAREDLGRFGDTRQSLGQGLRWQVIQVKVDVVLARDDHCLDF